MAEHYFTADPTAPVQPREVVVELDGRTWRLASDAGVFSADRLDPGTAVLLRSADTPRSEGTLLDLGCGYGPIAAVLAHRSPAADVWAVDVNARALALARANTRGTRVRVATPEDVPDDVVFDEVWSNPPIRIGKPALHALLLRWLGRLAPDGVAWLVVARHLGADSLQRWLGEQGWTAERHASSKGFRVLRVTRRCP